MKSLLKLTLFLTVMILGVVACKKDDFIDTGVHNVKFDGTVWQYLETRPDLFDTLMVALKISKLDEVLKKEEVTFFAPPDPTILKAVWRLNRTLYVSGQDTITKLEQIKPQVWRKYLGQYILKGKYLSKDFTQIDTINLAAYPGGVYKNYDGFDMNIGVLFNDVRSNDQVIKYAGYRQLYFNFPYSITLPGDIQEYLTPFITAPVATSDIQPTNGVLHVLQFSKHTLGFVGSLFASEAYTVGVLPN
ncbi:fasciclin domain-containing protein [Sphingobacterium zeae]|uniref:fasciclin domain-containing protein n=1 Tax=Sphingobacterium zeae TaxID=1776859 RepID=UPI003616B189